MLQRKFTVSFKTDFLEPLVSIGIPSYNCSAYILETLESVRRQTYSSIELIIIDDCSTDDSAEKIKQWVAECGLSQVRFLCNPHNLGLVKTCNLLLNEINGIYYSILGADDILLPSKIEEQVAVFKQEDESLAVVYSDVIVINERSEVIQESYFKRIGLEELPQGIIFKPLLEQNFIPALSVLIRTSVVKNAGGYDETLAFEDWDMWLCLAQKFRFHGMTNRTAKYRIHAKSMMQNEANVIRLNRSYIAMYKKYIGKNHAVDPLVLKKIQERSIYSYYRGDKEASRFLLWSFRHTYSLKVFIYLLLSVAGIRLAFSGEKNK